MTRRLSPLGALLVVTSMVLAACTTFGATTHSLMLAGEDPTIRRLPVTVTDESGHLRDVGQQLGFGGPMPDGPAWNLPGEPQKVLVSWTGGSCDEEVDLVLRNRGAGFGITMTTKVTPGGCDAMGIGRSVVLTFDRPVDAATVALES